MAKVILNEENLKSKHPDSFRILKNHSYNLVRVDPEDKSEKYRRKGFSHEVNIYSDGTWFHSYAGGTYHSLGQGSSHKDLEVHLKKVHK